MQTAIRCFHEFDRDYDIVNYEFDVIDEVRECVELFNELEETLTASWDIMFAEAKRYYEENGDLIVPVQYVNENGYRAGKWVSVQRRNYQLGQTLSESRIRCLESIEIHWESQDERFWNEKYDLCKKYFDEHNTLDGIRSYDKDIVNWLIRQRRKYHDGELSAQRTAKLEVIGMVWDFDDIWEEYFDATKKYYKKFRNLDIPVNYVTKNVIKLDV